jgi:hypothetical protein
MSRVITTAEKESHRRSVAAKTRRNHPKIFML